MIQCCECRGSGMTDDYQIDNIRKRPYHCPACDGAGWFPLPGEITLHCEERPGSEQKLAFLAYRYEFGLPLWHDADEIVKLTNGDAGGLPLDSCGITQPVGGHPR